MAKRDKQGLAARVTSLAEVADLVSGRLDDALVAETDRVAKQVDRRLAFAGNDTVIALAGPPVQASRACSMRSRAPGWPSRG